MSDRAIVWAGVPSHLQQNDMEGEKSEKAALNIPTPALMAERSKFMSAPDIL